MKTAIVLSFDDGRGDNYRAAQEVLIPLEIPATFNITTDYVEGLASNCHPCENQPMSREQVVALSKVPLFEIAGHGKQHRNEQENLIAGVEELREWCGTYCSGIASPNSALPFAQVEHDRMFYGQHGVHYVRLGSRGRSFARKVADRCNRFLNSDAVAAYVWKESLIKDTDVFVLPSVPILHHTTLREVMTLVKAAIKAKQSLILMFHSICKPGEPYYDHMWSWDYNRFTELCKKLQMLAYEEKIVLRKTAELLKKG